MISIVICSINERLLASVKENISNTIGLEYEIIAIDNRVYNYPICKAYNLGAQQAKFPYLCFLHEDVAFHTNNWGEVIVEQLNLADTGVVGFAGSVFKTKALSGWTIRKDLTRINLLENVDGKQKRYIQNPKNEEFSEVVTLDGLALFVSKKVWSEVKFDEELLTGFHLYDLDFTTAVRAAGYHNYVCHNVEIEHFSSGSFDCRWYNEAKKYSDKWESRLPLYVGEFSEKEIVRVEAKTFARVTYMLTKKLVLSRQELFLRVRKCFGWGMLSFQSIDIYVQYQKNKRKLPK